METSSYLHMSNKKKKFYLSMRNMDTHISSNSFISTDSLERSQHKSSIAKQDNSDENVDTILVPFYENDVLIKVPKPHKKGKKNGADKRKKDVAPPNYLVNKNKKSTSYLDMFRKQFASPTREPERPPQDEHEISSLQPEYGDTERDSISDDVTNPVEEFFNTESYNEIYYEKLLNPDIVDYLNDSIGQVLDFSQELKSKQGEGDDDAEDYNFRSVSEVAQRRSHTRYSDGHLIPNVKLGGLGPDMERIKPRLERARSLQRYSEKVRMENRLRIYKKSVEVDKKSIQQPKGQELPKETKDVSEAQNQSYLVNKSSKQKVNIVKRVYESKCKSANSKGKNEMKDTVKRSLKEPSSAIPVYRKIDHHDNAKIRQKDRSRTSHGKDVENEHKVTETKKRAKSGCKSKGINTECSGNELPPVQISFLVNVGDLRPSSALITLEEKHRMYQEQVRAFTLDNN